MNVPGEDPGIDHPRYRQSGNAANIRPSLGPASSLPQPKHRRILRGGEAEPSDWRHWFARAHIAWAKRHAPHLLEEWLA